MPKDEEWSSAVGLKNEEGSNPEEKSGKIRLYPWDVKTKYAFDLSQAGQINAFQYYVDELNNRRLPVGNDGPAGQEIAGFTDLFSKFGVPLSPKAKVEVAEKNVQWTTTEAAGQMNAGVQYIVVAVLQNQSINGTIVPVIVQMLVYTMGTSTPTWSPPKGVGNYAGEEAKNGDWPSDFQVIEGYNDGYPRTSALSP